jgi:aminoglycoside phosphotransferase (APT) family kinase protein
VLARLHSVDPEAAGLGGFGKPAGFVARQVGRWTTQWQASKQREVPEIDEVARRLGANLPPEGAPGIVHGDYSFNNTMFRKDEPTSMLAVLDWEMSTLGDPLTDVGMVANYWSEVGQCMWRAAGAEQPHRANPGFPSLDALLDRYARSSGRDLTHIDFYRALSAYKLACITEGGHARRVKSGQTDGVEESRQLVNDLADIALDATAAWTR